MGDADFRHGLVVGKFFPPHRGHAFLVRCAAQFCGRVTVGVFDHPSAALPLDVRAEALRELAAPFGNVTVVNEVDDVPIDYDDPAIWDRHLAIFRRGDRGRAARRRRVHVGGVRRRAGAAARVRARAARSRSRLGADPG